MSPFHYLSNRPIAHTAEQSKGQRREIIRAGGRPVRLVSFPTRGLRVTGVAVVGAFAIAGLHLWTLMPAVAASSNVTNPSFESGWASTAPAACWQSGGFGAGDATLASNATAHTGRAWGRVPVTQLDWGGDRRGVVDQHRTCGGPPGVGGQKYAVSTWYRA